MEKTKKVVKGSALEFLFVVRLLPPVLAGGILCLIQYSGTDSPLLQGFLPGAVFATLFLIAVQYLLWCGFIRRIWLDLFPARRFVNLAFFFSIVPLIGTHILFPLALLLPAKKREGHAFLWTLLHILLVFLLLLQIPAFFLPADCGVTPFRTYPQSLNIIGATLLLTLGTGFAAGRFLYGRAPSTACRRLMTILLLLLAGEYAFSIVCLNRAENAFDEVLNEFSARRIPVSNAQMKDFYQNGVVCTPGVLAHMEELRLKPDNAELYQELDELAVRAPLKDETFADDPEMRSSGEASLALSRSYDLRVREAAGKKDWSAMLLICHTQTAFLQTVSDEPAPKSFSAFAEALTNRARNLEQLLSGTELPGYAASDLEIMFRKDEERLRYAFRRAHYGGIAGANRAMGTVLAPPACVRMAKYGLGAISWTRHLRRWSRINEMLLKQPDPSIEDTVAASLPKMTQNAAFRRAGEKYLKEYFSLCETFFNTLATLRAARTASGVALWRAGHDRAIPDTLEKLPFRTDDPVTGKPFRYEKTADSFRLSGAALQNFEIMPDALHFGTPDTTSQTKEK